VRPHSPGATTPTAFRWRGTCIETIRPEAFNVPMSGDELLAWVERSVQDELH
jgi:hypothetical protein